MPWIYVPRAAIWQLVFLGQLRFSHNLRHSSMADLWTDFNNDGVQILRQGLFGKVFGKVF